MALQKRLLNAVGRVRFLYAVRSYSLGLGKKSKDLAKRGVEKIEIQVEKDPYKLVTYVCGTNLIAEGGEDIKIKPNEEYPEWLWKIHIGKPLPLTELDPETKEYWLRVQKMGVEKEKYLDSLQRHKSVHK